MLYQLRDRLSLLVTNIQVKWMEQYGHFDSDGMYVFTANAPMWVYRGQRWLGKLSLLLDPRTAEKIDRSF